MASKGFGYVSSIFYKTVISNSGKTFALDVVTKTTSWIHASDYPSPSVKDDFALVCADNADLFKDETATIAMRETEHPSDNEPSLHYTGYGLDKNGSPLEVKHLLRTPKSKDTTESGL